jgi:hypothetical protein
MEFNVPQSRETLRSGFTNPQLSKLTKLIEEEVKVIINNYGFMDL